MKFLKFIFTGLFVLLTQLAQARIPDPPWMPRQDTHNNFVLFFLDTDNANCGESERRCSVLDTLLWFKNYQPQKVPFTSDVQNLEPASKTFVDQYLQSGQSYFVASPAKPNPQVVVDRLTQTSCVSLSAKIKPAPDLPKEKHVVSNVALQSYKTDWRDEIYRQPLQALTQKVGQEFLQKMPQAHLSDLKVVSHDVVKNKSDKPHWLVVEFAGTQPTQNTVDAKCCFASLVVYDLFENKDVLHVTREADFSYLGFELLDAVDLDGNAVPELVFKERVMEVDSYLIYRYKDSQWYSVYETEGGGC